MDGSEKTKEKVAPKKSAESYVVLISFDLEDDTHFKVGDVATGLTPAQIASLTKMNAIAKEK